MRGTIGGRAGDNLTPQDVVESAAAFGAWLIRGNARRRVVIGRDARPSGPIVSNLVTATLQSLGLEVIDGGLSTTPTIEMAVPVLEAGGGIILTASHNPREWNALKLLNGAGEFISAEDGEELLTILSEGDIEYASVDNLGVYRRDDRLLNLHLEAILKHPLVNAEVIRGKPLRVVVDAVNSSGALAVPALLRELGCECILLNGEPNGQFAHNPEPLPQHLGQLISTVRDQKADLGVAVDPDVDRLALVGPGGRWIGEEYTLVLAADYILRRKPGPVVSNLSSTRALRDLARRYGQPYHASAVGEVNVVEKMKEVQAVIGGEGNGGVILPDLHYGRDALAGLALILSYLAVEEVDVNSLRDNYTDYQMVKDKITLTPDFDLDGALEKVQQTFADESIDTTDGVKIDFEEGWVHLRRSNTEPIVRIYAEATTEAAAKALAERVKQSVGSGQ